MYGWFYQSCIFGVQSLLMDTWHYNRVALNNLMSLHLHEHSFVDNLPEMKFLGISVGCFLAIWIDIARSLSMEVYTPTSNLQECLFPHIHDNSVSNPFDLSQSDSWKKEHISVDPFF